MYWVQTEQPGRLALVPRPKGDDQLADEIATIRHDGIDILVSLLIPEEAEKLGLSQEEKFCTARGIRFISFPIPDCSTPSSVETTRDLVGDLRTELLAGRSVGIHCRANVGRSPVIGACLLVSCGLSPEEAFRRLAEARGFPVPETTEQRSWVESFAQYLNRAHET